MSSNSTKHNADELVPPNWLNKDFFTKVLKHIEKTENIEIDNLKLKPATGKGDHYASIMFRVIIDFKINNDKFKSKSLILKTMPEVEGHKKEVFGKSFIFETEIKMYTKVIPKFKKILKDIGEEITLGPTLIYESLEPKKIIIFEDLLTLGYEVQREQKLSLDELKVAFEKLAKFHAVSHKILMEKPSYFDSLRYGIFNMKTFNESKTIINGIKYFIEMLNEHEDLQIYKPYFENLEKKNLLMSTTDSYNEYRNNPKNLTFYVLCHGDFHYKNMMLKRDPKNKNLLDLMLLDFQLSLIGPSVIDLIYSFYMLLNYEQRHKYFDELVYIYFLKLRTTLEKIGFKGTLPKLVDLKKQLFEHKDIELFLLTTFLPVWINFHDGEVEPDEMDKCPDIQRSCYQNPQYLKEVREVLPKYLYLGYLEE